jgi:hypothetical protein
MERMRVVRAVIMMVYRSRLPCQYGINIGGPISDTILSVLIRKFFVFCHVQTPTRPFLLEL